MRNSQPHRKNRSLDFEPLDKKAFSIDVYQGWVSVLDTFRALTKKTQYQVVKRKRRSKLLVPRYRKKKTVCMVVLAANYLEHSWPTTAATTHTVCAGVKSSTLYLTEFAGQPTEMPPKHLKYGFTIYLWHLVAFYSTESFHSHDDELLVSVSLVGYWHCSF